MCIHKDNIYEVQVYESPPSLQHEMQNKRSYYFCSQSCTTRLWVLPWQKVKMSNISHLWGPMERDISTGQYTWQSLCYRVCILVTDIIQAHMVHLNKGDISRASIPLYQAGAQGVLLSLLISNAEVQPSLGASHTILPSNDLHWMLRSKLF